MSFRLDTRWGRFKAWLSMHLVDHGFVRAMYNNFYALSDSMYRCSQPSPKQIEEYHAQYGIKTILNFRGENPYGSHFLEVEACEKLGIKLKMFRLYSRQPPTAQDIHDLKKVFAELEYPALMHCKSGADRAGMGATLYRILHLGHDVKTALAELNWRYGHFRKSEAGVLDFFLETYLARNAKSPISFMEWLDTEYDIDSLRATYEKSGWSSLVADRLLQRE